MRQAAEQLPSEADGPRELFVRTASKNGRPIVTMTALDYGDACVIDVQLGTTTGFELRDCLAERRSAPAPIIFITARDNVAALGPANGTGVFTWLRKPFRGQALVELLFQLRATIAK